MPAAKMNSVLASIPIWRAWAFCLQSWACGAAGSALPWHGRGRRFDPHRPYQPNRLKKHVLAQVHFPVYLSCTLPFSRNTMQSPQGAIASAGITSGLPVIHRQAVSLPVLGPHFATKIRLDFCFAGVSRPIGRCSPPENVLQVQSCTAFDEEPDYFIMATLSRLVQRRCVGVAPNRVVSVWIFARVKQQSNDLDMTKIRCQSECQMAVLTASARKQPTGIFNASQGCCHRQVDSSAAPDQGVHCLELAVQGCRLHRAVGIRSVIAQQID